MGALILDEDLILLVERGREPLIGLWSLPGGAVETGETLDAAVRREILEETGLEVEPIRVFEIFERIMRDAEGRPEYHYVLIDYICRVSGGTLAPADDVRRAEWISQRNLENYNLTEGTLDVIERAFGTHAGHQR